MRTQVTLALLITFACIMGPHSWGMEERVTETLYQIDGAEEPGGPISDEMMVDRELGFSPDGSLKAVYLGDGNAAVQDGFGKEIARYDGLNASQGGKVIFSPDNRFLVQFGYYGMFLHEFGKPAPIIIGTSHVPQFYGFSTNGQFIFANAGCAVLIIDRDHPKKTPLCRTGICGVLGINSNGKLIAARQSLSLVKVTNIEQEIIAVTLPHYQAMFGSFSLDDKLLALASVHDVVVWDLTSNQNIASWRIDDEISSIAFLSSGQLWITSSGDREGKRTTIFTSYCSPNFEPVESYEVDVSVNEVFDDRLE